MCFVDDTLTKPELAWWIINVLEAQIADSILQVDINRVIWLDLEERFGQVYPAQLYALEQKVSKISQNTASISE